MGRPRTLIPIGSRWGRLVAIEGPVEGRCHGTHYRCQCDCGKQAVVPVWHLRKGNVSSCGCLLAEVTRTKNLTHGETVNRNPSPEFRVWQGIITRCYNTNCAGYHKYGGRGIRMSDSFRSSFEAFLREVGRKPTSSHTIERINNSRGYEEGNIRWATATEQGRNKRNNVLIEFRGRTQCISAWAEELGFKPHVLVGRIKRGTPVEIAFTVPTGKPSQKFSYRDDIPLV